MAMAGARTSGCRPDCGMVQNSGEALLKPMAAMARKTSARTGVATAAARVPTAATRRATTSSGRLDFALSCILAAKYMATTAHTHGMADRKPTLRSVVPGICFTMVGSQNVLA